MMCIILEYIIVPKAHQNLRVDFYLSGSVHFYLYVLKNSSAHGLLRTAGMTAVSSGATGGLFVIPLMSISKTRNHYRLGMHACMCTNRGVHLRGIPQISKIKEVEMLCDLVGWCSTALQLANKG